MSNSTTPLIPPERHPALIEADKLRAEAKRRLASLHGIGGISERSPLIDRLVDCIIGAAILEVAALQTIALERGPKPPPAPL